MSAAQRLAGSKGGVWLLSNGLQSHFQVTPFACHCGDNGACGLCEIDVRLIDHLERMRTAYKGDIDVLNSCRCDAIPGSAHRAIATAADIRPKSRPFRILDIMKAAITVFSAAGGGVGLYISREPHNLPFLHVDLKTGRNNGFWYRENPSATKDGGYHYFKGGADCYIAFEKYVKKAAPKIYAEYMEA